MNTQELKNRIIARGEHSNHSHIVTGEATITRNEKGEIMIDVASDGAAVLKHLMETDWVAGKETWTGEHTDIPLAAGTYKYVPQLEFDPYENHIRAVMD